MKISISGSHASLIPMGSGKCGLEIRTLRDITAFIRASGYLVFRNVMKKSPAVWASCILFIVSIVLFVLLLRERAVDKPESQEFTIRKPETVDERMSYAYGLMVFRQLDGRGYRMDVEHFTNAVKTLAEGKDSLMSDEDMLKAFEDADRAKEDQQITEMDKENKQAGQAFLAANGKKEGVVTTVSGLQYQVIQEGSGEKPTAQDVVTVHYHGTLIDGMVFDSSVDRGEPASFPLSQVIAGWTEGVALMSKGAKYKFFIPCELAYGVHGSGGKIGPYSTLIFEVELIDF